MTNTLHLIVKGRVQGVYFRHYTQKQANKLHIYGWVKNLPNGDVEIMAQGQPPALQAFQQWCQTGPLLAKVSELIINEISNDQCFNHFEIH
jgi:acylphosphatase